MLNQIFKHPVVSVTPGTDLLQVAQCMAHQDVGCVLVVQEGSLCGLVTDRDIVVHCLAMGHDSKTCRVENVMTTRLKTVRNDQGIWDCIEAMKASQVRRLPIVDAAGQVVGLVSFGDLLALLGREFSDLVQTTTPSVTEEKKVA